ncbi:OB-fold nucleic acid binding domain-containing protein [uncultured Methanobrevibacter sp.]|uniref:OB-fold nucleic acid binding domain-containing protein n=1 Tax=uncultured Methanobrevibacter sp. TaxID=253161 RepID=UPI0025DA6602|nr:OB-fold nucleic acid binding domain-containing protein [uncultured Methanobrevibacter sp.]
MILGDKEIYKIALITTIIGVIGLIISSSYIETKELEIGEITSNNINEKISVNGVISEIKFSKNTDTCFLTLYDGSGKINIIVFESGLKDFEDHNININQFKNRKVKVTGTVTQYNNELELTIDDINGLEII